MRRPFAELWESLEARRRQVEAGEVSPSGHVERSAQEGWRASCCPDEEVLCGWVDGRLLRKHPRRWLQAWWHIQLQGCPSCRQNVATLRALPYPSHQPHARVQDRAAWRGLALVRRPVSRLPGTVPLAWAGLALVAVLGLALWSIGEHQTTYSFRAGAPDAPIREIQQAPHPQAPLPRIKPITDDSAGNLLLWGD
jgi:hypothetical protein